MKRTEPRGRAVLEEEAERRIPFGAADEWDEDGGQPALLQADSAPLTRSQTSADGTSRMREPTTELRRRGGARASRGGGRGLDEAAAPDLGAKG